MSWFFDAIEEKRREIKETERRDKKRSMELNNRRSFWCQDKVEVRVEAVKKNETKAKSKRH